MQAITKRLFRGYAHVIDKHFVVLAQLDLEDSLHKKLEVRVL